MRIVELLISGIIIINILYSLFYYIYNYLEFELKRYELIKIKIYLLEVSDRYIDKYGYDLEGESVYEYLGKIVNIRLSPVGSYCIYRILRIQDIPKQVFFCID